MEALKHDPDHPGAHFNLGNLLYNLRKDQEGADREWHELMRIDPKLAALLTKARKDGEKPFASEDRRDIRVNANQALAHYGLCMLSWTPAEPAASGAASGAASAVASAAEAAPKRPEPDLSGQPIQVPVFTFIYPVFVFFGSAWYIAVGIAAMCPTDAHLFFAMCIFSVVVMFLVTAIGRLYWQ